MGKIKVAFLIGIWLMVMPGISVAGMEIRHRLNSVTPEGQGCVLNVTVSLTNNGPAALLSADIITLPPYSSGSDESNLHKITSLSVGETVTADWAIPVDYPAGQLRTDMDLPLNFKVNALDISGEASSFELSSEGGL